MKLSVWFAALSVILIVGWVSLRNDNSQPVAPALPAEAAAGKLNNVKPPAPLASTSRSIEVRSHQSSGFSAAAPLLAEKSPNQRPFETFAFIEDKNGSPQLLSQAAALRACARLKSRLPTMRELAALAQSRGARGILEANKAFPQTAAENLPWEYSAGASEENSYYLVKVLDPDGKQDLFYYNPRGYIAPESQAERGTLLTSSLNAIGVTHAWGLNGANGVLGGQGEVASTTDQEKPMPGFARCIPSQP